VSTTNSIENEVKIRLDSVGDGLARIQAAGFAVRRTRVFETNILYDSPLQSLRKADSALRLRRIGTECILTYKGRPKPGPHKTREELETAVADFAAIQAILARLGYSPVFRYEKFRTEFGKNGEEGNITLDETPAGVFFELEGPPEWVDKTAKSLGFSCVDYITSTYGSLYLDHCRSLGIPAGDMVFDSKV
jgi:Adenylate cyclase, class 2 (thermophilic)